MRKACSHRRAHDTGTKCERRKPRRGRLGGIWEPEVGPLARRRRWRCKQSAARALGQDRATVVTCAADTSVDRGGRREGGRRPRHPCGSKSPATVIATSTHHGGYVVGRRRLRRMISAPPCLLLDPRDRPRRPIVFACTQHEC